MLSREDIRYIASLSRIHLKEDEVQYFTEQLGQILGYVEKLKSLNTQGVEPTSHVLPLQNVYREDHVQPSLPQNEALKIAVSSHKGYFKVPQVIE